MKINKSVVAASAIAIVGLGTFTALYANRAYAVSNSSNIIDRLALRFNLNRDDVQIVFGEHHSELKMHHEQSIKDRLAQTVTDGKITQAQADLITTKHAEHKAFMESLKEKTMEERREAMKLKMDELKQWAEDNDIPLQYLHLGMKGPHVKFGHRMGMPLRHVEK